MPLLLLTYLFISFYTFHLALCENAYNSKNQVYRIIFLRFIISINAMVLVAVFVFSAIK